MVYRLNTTGKSPVVDIPDLGGSRFIHPTIDYDLYSMFSGEEIRDSSDLIQAMRDGFITVSGMGVEEYLIYDFIEGDYDASVVPRMILFPEQLDWSLFKDRKFYFGERVSTTYYVDYDPTEGIFSRPVIRLEYIFHRDSLGYLEYRDRVIHWMLKNGQWSTVTKTSRKHYIKPTDKQQELTKRRINIVDEAQGLAVQIGLSEAIVALYTFYADEISRYRNGGSSVFRDALLKDSSFSWLNLPTSTAGVDIRAFLVSMFSVGLIE